MTVTNGLTRPRQDSLDTGDYLWRSNGRDHGTPSKPQTEPARNSTVCRCSRGVMQTVKFPRSIRRSSDLPFKVTIVEQLSDVLNRAERDRGVTRAAEEPTATAIADYVTVRTYCARSPTRPSFWRR
jgi:hypothetical protein